MTPWQFLGLLLFDGHALAVGNTTMNFVRCQDRGNTTQTSTRPVSEDAEGSAPPRWGRKRADCVTRVSTGGNIAEPPGNGWAHLTPDIDYDE